MQEFLLLALTVLWLAGAWLRIYRQARFYQIEEYMSRRYLQWALNHPRRLIPARPVGAWLIGLAIAWITSEAPDSMLPLVIAGIAALMAIIPQPAREIKKEFVRTPRVTRILLASLTISAAALVISHFAGSSIIHTDILMMRILTASAIGMAVYLLAPVWLVGGNLLMQPAEVYLRRRYLYQARQALAKINPRIIGITGSYGKTTTKAFLHDLMSLRYRTYATPKSYNTLMGISLAINRDLADDYRSEYFISEMGAYVPGEIERICQLTPPDIAIVTEIGPQHLERFETLENTSAAKYEIIRNLEPDGIGVFNWDNVHIQKMAAAGYPNTRLTVSRELDITQARQQNVTWIASDIQENLAGLSFTATHVKSGENARLETSLAGEHNVSNLLLCIAVAHHEGIPLRDIAWRSRTLKPAESRLVRQTTTAGITVINDAYSANPKGAASALKVLGMHDAGKRLLITPGMIELGAVQDAENRKLGQLAAQFATDIILIGSEQTQPILEALQETDFDMARVQVFETLAESVDWYQQHLIAADAVLFLNDLPDTYSTM